MISSVRGTVLSASGTSVVVEVGGVGLRVGVTPQLALTATPGTTLQLFTTLIVREDDLSLFGFAELEELRCSTCSAASPGWVRSQPRASSPR
jgi:Holliday junction DNA helicase RuvA